MREKLTSAKKAASCSAGVTVVDNLDGSDTITMMLARDMVTKFARLKVIVP